MSDEFPPIPAIDEMLAAMDQSWSALQAVVDAASPDDLTHKTDAAGWSAKDHLAHLDAWANSVLVMVRDRRPQWEGLGISKELFDEEGYDGKNAEIRDQRAAAGLDEVRSSLSATHEALLQAIVELSDEGLHRPANDFVPGSGAFEIAHKIMGNSYMHYDEHREYIERILAS
jgi:hypothetical protein